jgi:cation:H+ antiporter
MPAAGPQPEPRGRPGLAIGLAIAATLPGVFVHATGVTLEPLAAVFMFGLAVVGAAFMLAWAAEAVQLDVSAGLAIALLALVAVLPEYAVDFVFTWKAGKDPAKYAPDALANLKRKPWQLVEWSAHMHSGLDRIGPPVTKVS